MLGKLLEFFQHKKWLATLGLVLGLVGAALAGEITWAVALNDIVKAVIATILAQGAIDTAEAVKKG